MGRPAAAPKPARNTDPGDTGLSAAKAATSYDVARLAGVSQSAVSRCLTPGASVSVATRAKIMRAIDSLDYRPNAIARSLITQRSNMVAIVVANIGFHPEFTAYLSRGFSARGLHVLLFTLDHEADADRVMDQIWQYRVDGVIAAVRLPPQHVEMFAQRRTPLIFLNRVYEDMPVNSVCCDQAEGERMLVDRLIAAGHRRFGIIKGPVDSVVSSQRVAEVVARLRSSGISDVALVDGDFAYESGKRALHKLVELAGVPDVVVCANDMMAIGCMDAARYDLKLRVPDDLSVVGFDGMAQAYWASYDLVTIRQPTAAMVEAAVDMLMARVENPELGTEKRMFSGEFVAGTSARLSAVVPPIRGAKRRI